MVRAGRGCRGRRPPKYAKAGHELRARGSPPSCRRPLGTKGVSSDPSPVASIQRRHVTSPTTAPSRSTDCATAGRGGGCAARATRATRRSVARALTTSERSPMLRLRPRRRGAASDSRSCSPSIPFTREASWTRTDARCAPPMDYLEERALVVRDRAGARTATRRRTGAGCRLSPTASIVTVNRICTTTCSSARGPRDA